MDRIGHSRLPKSACRRRYGFCGSLCARPCCLIVEATDSSASFDKPRLAEVAATLQRADECPPRGSHGLRRGGAAGSRRRILRRERSELAPRLRLCSPASPTWAVVDRWWRVIGRRGCIVNWRRIINWRGNIIGGRTVIGPRIIHRRRPIIGISWTRTKSNTPPPRRCASAGEVKAMAAPPTAIHTRTRLCPCIFANRI